MPRDKNKPLGSAATPPVLLRSTNPGSVNPSVSNSRRPIRTESAHRQKSDSHGNPPINVKTTPLPEATAPAQKTTVAVTVRHADKKQTAGINTAPATNNPNAPRHTAAPSTGRGATAKTTRSTSPAPPTRYAPAAPSACESSRIRPGNHPDETPAPAPPRRQTPPAASIHPAHQFSGCGGPPKTAAPARFNAMPHMLVNTY